MGTGFNSFAFYAFIYSPHPHFILEPGRLVYKSEWFGHNALVIGLGGREGGIIPERTLYSSVTICQSGHKERKTRARWSCVSFSDIQSLCFVLSSLVSLLSLAFFPFVFFFISQLPQPSTNKYSRPINQFHFILTSSLTATNSTLFYLPPLPHSSTFIAGRQNDWLKLIAFFFSFCWNILKTLKMMERSEQENLHCLFKIDTSVTHAAFIHWGMCMFKHTWLFLSCLIYSQDSHHWQFLLLGKETTITVMANKCILFFALIHKCFKWHVQMTLNLTDEEPCLRPYQSVLVSCEPSMTKMLPLDQFSQCSRFKLCAL